MQEDGVQPNTHFFTALIRLCGRCGRALRAEGIEGKNE